MGTDRKLIWIDTTLHAQEWLATATVMKILQHVSLMVADIDTSTKPKALTSISQATAIVTNEITSNPWKSHQINGYLQPYKG